MARDRGKVPDRTSFSEDTIFKVYKGLELAGFKGAVAMDIVNQIQNQGILFRERTEETVVSSLEIPVASPELLIEVMTERARQIDLGYTLEHDKAKGPYHLLGVVVELLRRKEQVKALATLMALAMILPVEP